LNGGVSSVSPCYTRSWYSSSCRWISLLCFPIALVLAWYYDITRTGVVRTQPSQVPGLSGRSGRRIALASVVLVSLLTVVAGYYVVARLPGWWGLESGEGVEA
jgi:ABC-type uncharacterized transport system permease subunit